MRKHYLWVAAAAIIAMAGCRTTTESLLETEQYVLNDVHYLNDQQQDSIELNLVFELPTHLYCDSVLLPIQQHILGDLFGEAFAKMSADQALEAYAAMLKTEYLAANSELAQDMPTGNEDEFIPSAGMLCETQALSGQIMSMEHNVLSYSIERYVYTGGAHGLNYRQFVNYDLTTAQVITEQDLFTKGTESELTEMMLSALIEQNEDVQTEQDLRDLGYELAQLRPNGNFYLDVDGIVWVYNPYDIAPYAVGETVIMLPWADLQPLMK